MKATTVKSESKATNRSPFIQRAESSGFFGIQARLSVSKPKDKHEVEADQVADRVVNHQPQNNASFFSPAPPSVQNKPEEEIQEKPLAETITPVVQRKEDEDDEDIQARLNETVQKQENEEEEQVQLQQEEEEEPVQMKGEEEELQAKIESDTAVAPSSDASVESSLRQSRGDGSQLQGNVRSNLENSLGVDLSGVRIHTNNNAVQMTKKLNAQAFTNRNNIYFNEGKFNPATRSGQHLLAHEVTHTIQQGAVSAESKPENDSKQKESTLSAPAGSGKKESSTNVPDQNAEQKTGEEKAKQEGNKELTKETVPGAAEKKKTGKQDTPGAAKEGEKEPKSDYPKSPEEDPAFKATKQKIKNEAKKQRTHKPADSAAEEAQNAAPSPFNERESQAQASQVETMNEQEPGEFNAEAFKERLMQRIQNMQLPENQEQAADFENNNNIEEVSQAAQSDVAREQSQAAGSIEQATSSEPDVAAVPEREVEALPEPQTGSQPGPTNAQNAMPAPRPESQVNQPLQENMQEVDQTMAENQITDQQLSKANEPTFTQAAEAKQEARENTANAPSQFRQNEQQTLSGARRQAEAENQEQLQGMHGQRGLILNQVAGQQEQTGTRDTAEREKIATEINAIYEKTKTDVEKILESLDGEVTRMFSTAAKKAKSKFEAHVKQRMDAYKSRRYSGLRGKGRWLKDKFMGIPDEVNAYFTEGRKKYIDEMDVALTAISKHVAQKLSDAKNRITKGKQEVTNYVTALPESLQGIGREAAESIQSRFDELENSVDSKQDELIDSLAQQYTESLQEVDARIEEMKAANRGLVDKALDAVKGVIEIIVKIKNTLTNLLASAISVIQTIVADPIGFLGNLISGISQGFKNFGSNILKHLTAGLVGWLTGALGSMGISIPDDLFSLKGIFSLVMQVLGLTWDYIRKKAVKLLGEPVVKALETGFEIFQIIRKDGIAGLWNYIKEQFNDLKETVIGAIKEMVITQVIQAGIKWVLGLMNPAAAFVKAAMMIIDIVKFFIERGRQIIELVSAFIDGVKAVASGSVSKVAQAIENALAKAIPVVIGFLASLLGIGGLASKVQKLIKRIRARIDKAIDKVILKAKKWFRKAGSKVKGAVAKVFKWWKAKTSFKGDDGKNHKIYFTGEENAAKLMVASNPTAFSDFITSVDVGNDEKKKAARQQAAAIANQIDAKKRERVTGANETEKNNNRKKKQKELEELMKKLATHAEILFGTATGDLPETEVTYKSENRGGDIMGSSMVAKKLTKKGPGGSVPTSRRHKVFDSLLKRRKGGSSYYVRGHLLNHNVHGPGVWKNMTPLSKEGNRLHESGAESKVKTAVNSGAIVYYSVEPVYGRGELNTPNDAEPAVNEIRSAEKHVPTGLEVEANVLKPKTENFEKKESLVPKKVIKNPVDTALGNYQLTSSAKERVILTKDSPSKIVKNTGNSFSVNRIEKIQNEALKIENLNRYDQIKEKFQNNDGVRSSIEKLREMSNVVLK